MSGSAVEMELRNDHQLGTKKNQIS